MKEKYIMALDQGTTSSRCILFNHSGEIKSMAQKEFTQFYPKTGWVEHDPKEIWSSQIGVAAEAMAKLGVKSEDITAIGITNQRETTIIWNRFTGEPIYPAIVWQCHRTADKIEQLKKDGVDSLIRKKTGLIPDPYFSGTKIAWILEHVSGAREQAEKGELLFGTVDTWLIWNLTKGKIHVTDYTNASRTMLFDIHKYCWDEELLRYFKIPLCMMPKVKASGCIFGYTEPGLLGGEILIAGAAGDQQAALFGQCCFEQGDVKNTYGTGCFLLMNIGENPILSNHGLLTTITAGLEGTKGYALEGSVFVAGAAIQWLRDEQKMLRTAQESEELIAKTKNSGGVYIVPAFTGLGAPYWNPFARGTIVGITRGFSQEQMVRATVESIAYQAYDVIRAMEQDSGILLNTLKVDGGASANNFLMQFQANILNAQVQRPSCIETTALGAAYLAGLSSGYWNDIEEIKSNWNLERTFQSNMDLKEREELLHGWKRAVKCAIAWALDQ